MTGASRDRGVVFQGDDSLYGWLTAVENVEFGLRMRGVAKKERRERAMRFLELVGTHGQGQKYPAELSGGMKQRIQIARALVNEPTMLLMDEPFAALDAQTRSLMQVELASIWRTTRTTVLFITHDIDEAVTLGTRIGVMRAGPGSQVKGVLDVALDGARDRTDDVFLRYYRRVHEMIRDEVAGVARPGPDGCARPPGGSGGYGGYALGFVSLFVIWHLASVYLVGSVLFPPPTVVFRKGAVLVRSGVLFEHLWASLPAHPGRVHRRLLARHSHRAGDGFVPAGAEGAGAVHGVPALHPVRGHDHRRRHLVRDRRGLQDLPHHLHDRSSS